MEAFKINPFYRTLIGLNGGGKPKSLSDIKAEGFFLF